MITVCVNKKEDSQQYEAVLTKEGVTWPKRTTKSKINEAVTITPEGVKCVSNGKSTTRVSDCIDKVLESYEEEFEDFQRNVNLIIDGVDETVVRTNIINYLLGTMFINEGSINGLQVR